MTSVTSATATTVSAVSAARILEVVDYERLPDDVRETLAEFADELIAGRTIEEIAAARGWQKDWASVRVRRVREALLEQLHAANAQPG